MVTRSDQHRGPESVDHPNAVITADGSRSFTSINVAITQSGSRSFKRTSSASESIDNTKARQIGRFTVLGTLGRGGMGVVLRAYDSTLARMVALKLLNQGVTEPNQQRLLREGQALAQLSHPNVVQVYEMGVVREQMFIAMELVDGEPLRTWQHAAHSWTEVLDVYLQAGHGLVAAHERNLIHRDFKPENCIMGSDGRVRVVDFGLARGVRILADDGTSPVSFSRRLEDPDDSLDLQLTQSGVVMGTLRYLPLRQLWGDPADAKSDQYSFCVSLHEGLYGMRPFADSSLSELLRSLSKDALLPVPRSKVPARIRRILLRGLARSPAERWSSMAELLAALEQARRPRRWVTLSAAAALVGVSAGSVVLSYEADDPCTNSAAGLGDTWDTSDQDAVHAAFLHSGPTRTPQLLQRVEGHLNDFSRAWAQMAEQSCRATFVDHTQSEQAFDRRMQCLQRHRSRLRFTIDSMAEARNPQEVVERTILPFKLPSLDACADVDGLMAGQPLPGDPLRRDQIEQMWMRIDRAHTLHEAGELTRALGLAEAIVTDSRAIEYTPVLAEALECLGRVQVSLGTAQQAQATLEEAIEVSALAKADEVAARVWALLVHALMSQGKLEQAATLERAARAAIERANDQTARGWLLDDLGVLYGERDEPLRARRYFQHALEVKQQALGEDHVDVGLAWVNLGFGLQGQGQGQLEPAQQAFEHATAIFKTTVGPSHPHMATVDTGLGHVFAARGEHSTAMEHYRRALTVRQAVFQADHPHVAQSLRHMGEVEIAAGRLLDAREHLQLALAIDEGTLEAKDLELARVLIGLAKVELADGHPHSACEHAQSVSTRIQSSSNSHSNAVLADAHFVQAQCLWDSIDTRPRARDLAEQARETLASRPTSHKAALLELDAWLREHPRPPVPTPSP